MSVYTAPATNAVDFELTAFTPADVSPFDVPLSAHTVPALTEADFALLAYTEPTFHTVDWDLLAAVVPPVDEEGGSIYNRIPSRMRRTWLELKARAAVVAIVGRPAVAALISPIPTISAAISVLGGKVRVEKQFNVTGTPVQLDITAGRASVGINVNLDNSTILVTVSARLAEARIKREISGILADVSLLAGAAAVEHLILPRVITRRVSRYELRRMPRVVLTTRDIEKAEKIAKRVDPRLVAMMNAETINA